MTIPAQRQPLHDELRPEDARPVRVVYSATVNAQPDQTRTGDAP